MAERLTAARRLVESATHWERLADEADAMDAHERSVGIFVGAGMSAKNHQAATYRKVARCQRLEAETGLQHCHCHERSFCPLGNTVTDAGRRALGDS